MMASVWNTVVGMIALLVMPVSSGWGTPSRDEIRSKNATSQADIVTLQAHVKATIQFNLSVMPKDTSSPEKYVIDYTRSGDKERFKELEGPLDARDLIRDSRSKMGSEFRQPPVSGRVATVILSDGERTFPLEIWEWALFELPECKQPLSRLLDESEVQSIKSTTEADRPVIYLDIRDTKDRRYEVWVDPSVNYLVRKFVCYKTVNGIDMRIEGNVQSFREVKAGVFFPEHLNHAVSCNGTWYQKGEMTLTNIQVNESLPAGFFKHKLPPGTMVTDATKGTIYTIGPDGQPGKSAQALSPLPAGSIKTPAPPKAEKNHWPSRRIVLIVSSLVVAVVLGVFLWKRRKEAKGA